MSQASGVVTPLTSFPNAYVNNGFSFDQVFVSSTGINSIGVTAANGYTYLTAVSGATVTVPVSLASQTAQFVVADWGGYAGTGVGIIHVTGASSSVTFNGALGKDINSAYGSLKFYSSGTSDWRSF